MNIHCLYTVEHSFSQLMNDIILGMVNYTYFFTTFYQNKIFVFLFVVFQIQLCL